MLTKKNENSFLQSNTLRTINAEEAGHKIPQRVGKLIITLLYIKFIN